MISIGRGVIGDLKALLDVKSAYPYTEIFLNISKATTILELCKIEGVTEEDRRIVGLNVTGGNVNATEFCMRILGAPSFEEIVDLYEAEFEADDKLAA